MRCGALPARVWGVVGRLAKPFNKSQRAISRHLRVLKLAGMIEPGRRAHCRPRKIE
ncbi:MAG: ArsR family transcriptional regulator [bacterium]